MYALIARKIIYFIFLTILSIPLFAQEQAWQMLGHHDQDQISSYMTSTLSIALSPTGIPYAISADTPHDNKVLVKRYVGGKWEMVGNGPLSEDYTQTAYLDFGPDGSLYATYQCVIEGPASRVNVKKLVNNRWVNVGKAGINADGSPSLAFGSDGSLFMAFSSNYYNFGGNVVRKFEAGQWNLIGTTGINSISVKFASDNRLVINQDELYLAYSDAGLSNKIVVKKYVKGYWMLLGKEGFSDGQAKGIDMCFSKKGILHVIYQDVANGDKITVKKFSDDQWETVGIAGFSKGASSKPHIRFSPDDVPFISYTDNSLGDKAIFGKYEGNAWVLSDISPHSSIYTTPATNLKIDQQGNPYVSFVDVSLKYRASVKKLSSGKWEGLGINGISPEAATEVRIRATADHTPYLAYVDVSDQLKATVKKFTNGSWEVVGTKSFTGSNTKFIDLALDQQESPHLTYRDGDGLIWVKRFNGSTWQNLGGSLSAYSASDAKIEMGSDGNPIVAYIDQSNGGKILVKRFNGTSWVAVGTNAVSGTSTYDLCIKRSKGGTLYVLYNDLSTYIKNAHLKKLVNNVWEQVGIANFTNSSNITGLSLGISDDETPYVAYCDGGNKYKPRVKKFSGGAWMDVGSFLSATESATTSIVFSKSGDPIVSHQEYSGLQYSAAVSTFKNGSWAKLNNSVLAVSASNLSEIVADPTGDIFIGFTAGQAFAARLVSGKSLPPFLYSFQPSRGFAGELVTIKGDNFSQITGVQIGGKAVASFKVNSPTEIIAELAVDHESGEVVVTGSLGDAHKGDFVFLQHPPIISSLSQLSGEIGSSINISGNYFSPVAANNIVYFGPVRAEVTSATSKMIRVVVPAYSAHSDVTVTVNQQTAVSPQPFLAKPAKSFNIDANTFSNRKDFESPTQPQMIKLGDIDGDGKPDVIVTHEGADLFSVLLNKSTPGKIAFGSRQGFGQGFSPQGLSVTDLDGDGKLDLLLANGYTGAIIFFRNTSSVGNVSFATPAAYGYASYPFTASGADMDLDGRPDMIVANINGTQQISVIRNVDFSNAYLYADNAVSINTFLWSGATVADLNGDYFPDVIATTLVNIELYQNSSQPAKLSFMPAKVVRSADSDPSVPAIADLDGDGKPDLITTNTRVNKLNIFRNQSTTATIDFAEKQLFDVHPGPGSAAVGDFNGDGLIDVITCNNSANPTISLLQNNSTRGNIAMSKAVSYPVGRIPSFAITGDIDGDGYTDIIVTNRLDNNISVFRNKAADIELPANNFNIAATGATCVGENNGTITINASLKLAYVAKLMSGSGEAEYAFNDQLKIEKLKAGSYTLTIYVKDQQDNAQSFTLSLGEPKALSVYATVQEDKGIISLALDGGNRYLIMLNGKSYITTSSTIDLPLATGSNSLEIGTGLDCQGVYKKLISYGPSIKLYPNPVENTLTISLNKASAYQVSVRINDMVGRNVFKQEYTNTSSAFELNLSNFAAGVYLVSMQVDGVESRHKIIKR